MSALAFLSVALFVQKPVPTFWKALWALAKRNIRPHPMRGWTDAVDLKNGGWQGLPRTLIICGGQKYRPSSDAMLGPAKSDPGFRRVTLPISRLGMVSKPALVAKALLAEGTRAVDG